MKRFLAVALFIGMLLSMPVYAETTAQLQDQLAKIQDYYTTLQKEKTAVDQQYAVITQEKRAVDAEMLLVPKRIAELQDLIKKEEGKKEKK